MVKLRGPIISLLLTAAIVSWAQTDPQGQDPNQGQQQIQQQGQQQGQQTGGDGGSVTSDPNTPPPGIDSSQAPPSNDVAQPPTDNQYEASPSPANQDAGQPDPQAQGGDRYARQSYIPPQKYVPMQPPTYHAAPGGSRTHRPATTP
jgi:hypothetical protein